MKRKCFVAIIIVCLLILGASPGASWAEKKPYVIGAVLSVTGAASFLGEPERNTVKMIEDWVNAAGGINGHPLKIIVEDSKSEESQAVLSVQRLLEKDKVLAIVGPSTTGESMAVVPIMEKAKTPLISCAAALSIVTPKEELDRILKAKTFEMPKKQNHWIFKTPQTDTAAVETIYDHMKKKGISRVAIITVTTGFGDFGRKELKRVAPAYGISIIADELYGPKDSDMTAQLTKIKGTDAQAVVNWSVGPPQVIVTKNWKQLSMNIPLYQSHGFGSKRNIELAGGAAEGVLCPLGRLVVAEKIKADHPQKPVIMKYKTEYEKLFKAEVSTFGGHAYDGIMMLVEALKAVGPNKAKIRDYLETKIKNWPGTGGVFNMSAEDHTGLKKDAFEMIVVKDGDWAFAD
ncbi:MAG: ABC transporter substrate-binding protein [Thermodesulfobacteriota bacterium]|nr:ABC transporter substrate-binding protein [Thermodesulfobacteriota bacterium]